MLPIHIWWVFELSKKDSCLVVIWYVRGCPDFSNERKSRLWCDAFWSIAMTLTLTSISWVKWTDVASFHQLCTFDVQENPEICVLSNFKFNDIMYRPGQPNWDFWLWIFHSGNLAILPFWLYVKSVLVNFWRSKTAVFTILEALNFDLRKKFTLQNFQKFKIQICTNGQNGSSWGFEMTKINSA